MGAEVINAGPMTLIQDLGRNNVAYLGLSQGGALDEHSFLWANKLLDNPANLGQIELNIGPLKLRFAKPTMIAITGADMDASLNGLAITNWSSHKIAPGDVLAMQGAKTGLRAYIAIKGGWQLRPIFNSLSSVPREGIGYFIKGGNQLPYLSADKTECAGLPLRSVPKMYQSDYQASDINSPCTLNLIPGYQFKQFSAQAIENLLTQTFQVSAHCDRMGFRLKGKAIPSPTTAFQSEGIALGSIQIPADGQAIILLKDRQTIGGYPKPGCVAHLDLNKLAQLRPGSYVQFALSSLQKEIIRRNQFLKFFGIFDE